MRKKKKSKWKACLGILLSASLLMQAVPAFAEAPLASAAEPVLTDVPETYAAQASPSGISLGTSALRNPDAPVNASGKWANGNGYYVYFGRFPQSDTRGIVKEPIKWRVLNLYNDSKEDGNADSIFLLSDKALYEMPLNENYGDNIAWIYTNMRAWLNSEAFGGNYLEGGFYDNAFTELEKSAVNNTVKKSELTFPSVGTFPVFSDFAIDGDKIFIPSMNEVENISHGFYRTLPYYAGGSPWNSWIETPNNTIDFASTAFSDSLYNGWAYTGLRSTISYNNNGGSGGNWCMFDSAFYGGDVDRVGEVVPACNLNKASVAFTRPAVEKNTYYLVLKDESRKFEIADSSGRKALAGDELSFDYENGSEGGVTCILTQQGSEAALKYEMLEHALAGSAGTASFALPSDLEKGVYCLHLFSEYSGCASPFQEVLVEVTDPVASVQSGETQKAFASFSDAASYAKTLEGTGDVTVTVSADDEVSEDLSIGGGVKVEIAQNATLSVAEGVTLENSGIISNAGTVSVKGTIANNGEIRNGGSILGGAITGGGEYSGNLAEMDQGIRLLAFDGVYDGAAHLAATVEGARPVDLLLYSENYDEENPNAATWSRQCPVLTDVSDNGKIAVKISRTNYREKIVSGRTAMKPKELEPAMVSRIPSMGYTGEAVLPAVTVKDRDASLQEERDYRLSYEDNLNVGTGAVHVSGIGNYTGTVTRTFSIKLLQAAFSMADPGAKAYGDPPFELETSGGSGAGEVAFEMTGDVQALRLDGSRAVVTGAGTVTVTAIKQEDDNYAEASDSKTVTVAKRSLGADGVTLSGAGGNYTYTGAALKPVTVTDSGAAITPDDYDIFYQNNKNAGEAKVTVVGKGNYEGTLTGTFTIEKASLPAGAPSHMRVDYSNKKLSDVALSENWEWRREDRDLSLEVDMSVEATAVYRGSDAGTGNYESEQVTVFVTREACRHDDESKIEKRNEKAATCRTEGYSGDTYCLACGLKIADGETLPALDHPDRERRGAVPATCQTEGYTGDTYCLACGEKLSDGEAVPKTAHRWEGGARADQKPSCVAAGSGSVHCADCGEKKPGSEVILPATGHAWDGGSVTTPATAGRAGVKTFSCMTCGATRTEEIPKLSGASSGTPSDGSGAGSEAGTENPSVIKAGDGYYRILSGSSAEYYQTLPGSAKKSLTIKASVKLDGRTYRVTSVAKGACKGNKNLSSVTIGKNISKIGADAFSGCRKLKKITVKTTKLKTKSVGKNAFKGIYAKASFKVPKSKLSAYRKIFKKTGAGKKAKFKK